MQYNLVFQEGKWDAAKESSTKKETAAFCSGNQYQAIG